MFQHCALSSYALTCALLRSAHAPHVQPGARRRAARRLARHRLRVALRHAQGSPDNQDTMSRGISLDSEGLPSTVRDFLLQ